MNIATNKYSEKDAHYKTGDNLGENKHRQHKEQKEVLGGEIKRIWY